MTLFKMTSAIITWQVDILDGVIISNFINIIGVDCKSAHFIKRRDIFYKKIVRPSRVKNIIKPRVQKMMALIC